MKSNKFSDLFSILGTLYLWMFWPSFNGAYSLSAEQRHRTINNTFLSLCGCCISTFIVSRIVRRKFGLPVINSTTFIFVIIQDIQNATLAGGVAIGASADLFQSPFNAVIIGCTAGTVSTLGFNYLQPYLEKLVNPSKSICLNCFQDWAL